MKRLNIVGTAVKNVIGSLFGCESSVRRYGAARRSHVASRLKGKRNSMVEPAKRGAKRALITP